MKDATNRTPSAPSAPHRRPTPSPSPSGRRRPRVAAESDWPTVQVTSAEAHLDTRAHTEELHRQDQQHADCDAGGDEASKQAVSRFAWRGKRGDRDRSTILFSCFPTARRSPGPRTLRVYYDADYDADRHLTDTRANACEPCERRAIPTRQRHARSRTSRL